MSSIIVDEEAGTLTITECSVTFPYGFAPSTRVGTIVITPAGGVASFPIATQGASGLSPDVDIVVHPVDPDDPLPDPSVVKTTIDPGGPGEAAHYKYDIYIHKGQKGDAPAVKILEAEDLQGAGGLGVGEHGYVLSYVNDGEGSPGVVFIPQRRGDLAAGMFEATGWSNTSPRLLISRTIGAKPFPWRPIVFGFCPVTGSADTRVDLVARLGNADTGFEVGRCPGVTGAAPPPPLLVSAPDMAGYTLSDESTYVAAGSPGTVYLRAEQQATTNSSWSTGPGRFSVYALPI